MIGDKVILIIVEKKWFYEINLIFVEYSYE